MNGSPVTADTILTPNESIISLKRIELHRRDAIFTKVGKMHEWRAREDSAEIKVVIVSSNSFITDFIRGLVEAHGYKAEEVTDVQQAQVNMQNGFPQILFVDDFCLEKEEIKNILLRLIQMTGEGVPIILLANEQTKLYVEQLPAMTYLQVLEKPVDYLRIGQVMADLTNV